MQGAFEIIKDFLEGLDQRRKRFALIGIGLLVLLSFLIIDYWTGWSYYGNLEKKTALLESLHKLSVEGIAQDPGLYPIYQDIVSDLTDRTTPNISIPSLAFISSETFWKAISGASFWLIFVIAAFFGTFGKENIIVGIVGVGFIALFFGIVGALIPTIVNPWVNYIGFPLLQIIVVLFLSRRANKKKRALQK